MNRLGTNHSHGQTMSVKDWSLLFLLSLIWGGSFLFARIAVLEVPPLTVVLMRVLIAAIALNFYILLTKSNRWPSPKMWLAFAGMGVLNNIIPFSLIFYGQQEIGAGLAAIVNAMTPIWTLLIAHWFTNDERLSLGKAIGIVLGFIGVGVLIGPSSLEGLSGSAWAQIAVLGATISYGMASVYGKRFTGIEPMQSARGQLTASALLMLPIAAYFDQFWALSLPSSSAIWSIILLALLCTAFAYILFFKILANSGAVNISLVTLLVPISAIVLGYVVLKESIAPLQFFGMVLIMLGLLVIDGRLLSLFKKRKVL